MMRMLRWEGMTVSRAVRRFAASRPPGIYKEEYLAQLFKYHHEVSCLCWGPLPVCPVVCLVGQLIE